MPRVGRASPVSELLAAESERALAFAIGFLCERVAQRRRHLPGSDFVSAGEWRTFVDALRLRDDYPGMLGLGWVEHGLNQEGSPNDMVRYLEPGQVKGVAPGLDLQQRPRPSSRRGARRG